MSLEDVDDKDIEDKFDDVFPTSNELGSKLLKLFMELVAKEDEQTGDTGI
jgi:hypothetical protein